MVASSSTLDPNKRECTMTKTLKTMTLSAALAAMFLSAGAFAGAKPSAALMVNNNVTIIHKNSAWPVKGQITSNPCAAVRCVEA
jgi:hypothetical protein